MDSAGNIEAIRDWANRYYYKESQIADFFIKADSLNLTAYKLTLIGPTDREITITENAQTNPQSYIIKTDSTGIYVGLFFFHSGSTLSFEDSLHSQYDTYTLSSYVDVIELTSIILATPAMTGYSTPAGTGTVSASSEYAGRPAWRVFDQNTSNFWTTAINTKIGEWIQYKFDVATTIVKVTTRNTGDSPYISVMKGFKVQGSNDDTNWADLKIITNNPFTANYEYTFYLDNPGPYRSYRFICTDVWSQDPANGVGFGEIYLYKPGA